MPGRFGRVGRLSRFPHEPGPHWGEVGIHGVHRPREWDTVVLVRVPSVTGAVFRFTALRDGSEVVESDDDLVAVSALARAIDHERPYRAEAVRRDATTWAVGLRGILVVELPESILGDELELVWDGRERSARVGGAPSLASVIELETLASARFDTWVVRARRLRDRHWEVEVGPL